MPRRNELSSHEETWKKPNCKSRSERCREKGYILFDFNYITFQKRQNYGNSKKIRGFQELGRKGDEQIEHRGYSGQWKLP